jgi:hypothetical protein
MAIAAPARLLAGSGRSVHALGLSRTGDLGYPYLLAACMPAFPRAAITARGATPDHSARAGQHQTT